MSGDGAHGPGDLRDPTESWSEAIHVDDPRILPRSLEVQLNGALAAWIDAVAARRGIPRRDAGAIVLQCVRALAARKPAPPAAGAPPGG